MEAILKKIFIAAILLLVSNPAFAKAVGEVARTTSVMSEPDRKSEVLSTLKAGDSVEIVGKSGTWLKVLLRLQGDFSFQAWVSERDVKQAGAVAEKLVSRQGTVSYVTAAEAYVTLGLTKGMREGTTIRISRNGKEVGSCVASVVEEHLSICTVRQAKVGDLVTAMTGKVNEDNEEARIIERLPASEVERRLALVRAAVFSPVPFTGSREYGGRMSPVPLDASFEHYASSTYQRERADLSIRDMELGVKQFTASLDLSTWYWSSRPSSAHFRPDTDVQLYLYEASVSNRNGNSSLPMTLGRIRPWNLPGLTMLDGVQVGWKAEAIDAEIGVYGGLLPSITSLKPGSDPWVVGLYFEKAYVATKEYLLRQELRVGLTHEKDVGSRAEVETLLRAGLKRFMNISLGVRAGLWSDAASGGPSLDAINMDLGFLPAADWRVQLGAQIIEQEASDGLVNVPAGSRRGDLTVQYTVTPTVAVSLNGGGVDEIAAARSRVFGGPELLLRKIIGPSGDLLIGYQEERGWIDGRLMYVQPSMRFLKQRTRLLLRGSYSQDNGGGGQLDEWGIYNSVENQLLSWMSLRVAFQVRGGGGLLGYSGTLDLTGRI